MRVKGLRLSVRKSNGVGLEIQDGNGERNKFEV